MKSPVGSLVGLGSAVVMVVSGAVVSKQAESAVGVVTTVPRLPLVAPLLGNSVTAPEFDVPPLPPLMLDVAVAATST